MAGKNPKPRLRIKKITFFQYKIDNYISLPKPSRVSNSRFLNVLLARNSQKKFNKLSLNKISSLLWYSAKVKKVILANDSLILTHRGAPSAGGIHPIDIFISLPAISNRVLYYYDPYLHKLGKIDVNQSELVSFFDMVSKNLNFRNATIIWFGADMQRTEQKYQNSNSLVWRDAGALIMLFQLVATAFKIKCCPIGTLGEPYFSSLFKHHKKFVSAGGLMIG